MALGLVDPAAAQELPTLPSTVEVDVAAAVSDAIESAVDVELPTIDVPVAPTPTATAGPAEGAAESPSVPSEAAPEPQYQPAEPQYQDAEVAPVEEVPTADTTPAEESSPAVVAEPAESAVEVAAPTSEAGLPATWTWNWNWNCEDEASIPEAPANAGTWEWNWNWNCDPEAVPAIDLGQYQAPITQYQPGNLNLGIRIGSPGDDGPVTQTISTVTQVTATVVTEVTQTIVQATEAAVPPVVVTPTPSLPLPWEPGRSGLPLPVLPPSVVDLGVLPPIVVPPLPGIPSSVIDPLAGLLPTAAVRPPVRRPRPPLDRARGGTRSTLTPTFSFSSAWRPVVPAFPGDRAHARPESASAPTPQREQRRRPFPPLPGGSGLGAGQSASAPAIALGALAAMIAAYLLVPPLGARRLRRARDRRRLGLLAAPLERPG